MSVMTGNMQAVAGETARLVAPAQLTAALDSVVAGVLTVGTTAAESTTSVSRTSAAVSQISQSAKQAADQVAELMGVPCLVLDRRTGQVVGESGQVGGHLPFVPPAIIAAMSTAQRPEVHPIGEQILYFFLPFREKGEYVRVIAGYVRTSRDCRPPALVMAAADVGWSEPQFTRWLTTLPSCDLSMLNRMVKLAVKALQADTTNERLKKELDDLRAATAFDQAQIRLLQSLAALGNSESQAVEIAAQCVERLDGLLSAGGVAVLFEVPGEGIQFQSRGQLPVDRSGFERLVHRFRHHDWTVPMVKNNLEGTLLGADFPGLTSLLIVGVSRHNRRRGWLVALNSSLPGGFGDAQSDLLSSVGRILTTQLYNQELHQQHEDLVIGFVRSLVSSLDAKDPYTRGHSERVALVSRRLGQQLKLPEDDLEAIYLSGLLHDLGKIGVDDRILRKPDQLTPEEFEQIQRHPMIGYQILKQLGHLQHVLPGVRSHHESFNGKGYPDKLVGDAIPLMARIIAVADSYDAMSSDRPYRPGMPLEKLEEIFRRGANVQWDGRVIDAYFACREDIRRLCKEYTGDEARALVDRAATSSLSMLSRRSFRR